MYETNKIHHFVLSTISKGMRSFDIIYGANTSTKCYQIHKTFICTAQPFFVQEILDTFHDKFEEQDKKKSLCNLYAAKFVHK